jgi:hypothetical protein
MPLGSRAVLTSSFPQHEEPVEEEDLVVVLVVQGSLVRKTKIERRNLNCR